jgi:nitrogen regulatory protein PII
MPAERAKLVTIISGEENHSRIATAVTSFGARGFTFHKVAGHGTHGTRPAGFFDSSNETFSVVVTEEIANRILDWVEKELVPSAAVIAYCQDVLAIIPVRGTETPHHS